MMYILEMKITDHRGIPYNDYQRFDSLSEAVEYAEKNGFEIDNEGQYFVIPTKVKNTMN